MGSREGGGGGEGVANCAAGEGGHGEVCPVGL